MTWLPVMLNRAIGAAPHPAWRPFTPHLLPFAAKPLIQATRSDMIGLHGLQ